jgi:hypothetical protein
MIITYHTDIFYGQHEIYSYGTIKPWTDYDCTVVIPEYHSHRPSDCLWIVPGTIDPMEG